MSYIADLQAAGYLPAQHHEEGFPLELRHVRYAVRLLGREPSGHYKADDETYGDLLGALVWKPEDRGVRPIPAWAFAWAATVTTPPAADPEERQGGTQARADPPGDTPDSDLAPKVRPLASLDHDADERFRELPPRLPDFATRPPKGWPGVVLATAQETRQREVFVPGAYGLIAPHADGEARFGTVVLDLDDEDRPDMARRARLQSLCRVVVPEASSLPMTARPALAVEYGLARKGGFPGLGLIADDAAGDPEGTAAEPPSSEAIIGSETGSEGGTVVRGMPLVPPAGSQSRGGGGAGAGSPAVIAAMAHRAGGPVDLGGGGDVHQWGLTRDGEPMLSAHVSTEALYRGDGGDGALDFEPIRYEEPKGLPHTARVHLRWDPAVSHRWIGGAGPGRWRWLAEAAFYAPKEWIPGGGKKRPPGDPGEPGEPEEPEEPEWPGGRLRRPRPVPPQPPGEPPWRPGPGQTRPRNPIPGFDPNPEDPYGPWGRFGQGPTTLPMPPQGGFPLHPEGLAPFPPESDEWWRWAPHPFSRADEDNRPAVARDIGETPERLNATWRPTVVPALLLRPPARDGAVDPRRLAVVPDDLRDRQDRTAPVVGRLEALAADSQGVVGYTERPGTSRYPGGTAPGALLLLPPEISVDDVDRYGATPPGVTLSPVELAALGASARFAVGNAFDRAAGKIVTGYDWGLPASGLGQLVFRTRGATGTATERVVFGSDVDEDAGLTVKPSSALQTGDVVAFQLADGSNGFVLDPQTGKVTMPGLLDPSGVLLTPRAARPAGSAAGTLWVSSADSRLYYYDGSTDKLVTLGSDSSVPTGTISAYGGTSAPSGYLLCDGSAVSRTTYAALFAVLSTAFGAGDGSTTFNVPDLRQRFPLGKAAAGTGSTLGGTGGNIDHAHAIGTIAAGSEAAHTHAVDVPSTTSGTPSAQINVGSGVIAVAQNTHTHDTDPASFTSGAGTGHTHAMSGATAADNPPFQAVNYIVKT